MKWLILAALLLLPVHHTDADELPEDRAARLDTVAEAIAQAAEASNYPGGPRQAAALLVAVLVHESWLARSVYYDEAPCREGWEGMCDGGAAWSIWQIHGTDRSGDVHDAAALAIDLLSKKGRACGGSGEVLAAGAVSSYATGSACSWKGTAARMKTFRWTLRVMSAHEQADGSSPPSN